MRRGFLSMVLVLVMVLVLAKDLEIYGRVYAGMQEIKGSILLGQEIRERTYELEDGFRLTVHDALKSIPAGEAFRLLSPKEKEAVEKTASSVICAKVRGWLDAYNYSEYVGYVDANDYSEKGGSGTCEEFLYVNLDEGTAEIKDIKTVGSAGRIAFRFSGKVGGSSFIVLIPEGTVIA